MARALRALTQPVDVLACVPSSVFRTCRESEFRASFPPPRGARTHRDAGARQLLPARMLTGRYPVGEADGLPPYLTSQGQTRAADAAERIRLVDGSITEYLRTRPSRSVDGFALSNIAEWLDDWRARCPVRRGRPHGQTRARASSSEISSDGRRFPERWRHVLIEWPQVWRRADSARPQHGPAARGRVRGGERRRMTIAIAPSRPLVRRATPDDNAALIELAAACPMDGDVGAAHRPRPRFLCAQSPSRRAMGRWHRGRRG